MRYIFTYLLMFATLSGAAQNGPWKGYFSYKSIKDLTESPSKITAAAENALFSREISGAIKTTNTIDGLSGRTITAVYHSENFRKTLIGYENGLIVVVNEADGKILNVVDIISKTLPPNIKRINHFMEFNGIAYISCDFGICQYKLSALEFGDTYFIGDNGAQISIKQTAVFQNKIYAASASNGIRSANIDNPNLNDFNQWTPMDSNGWNGVEAFANTIVATTSAGSIQKLQGNSFVAVTSLPQPAVDFRAYENYLIATTPANVYIYNTSLLQVRTVPAAALPEEHAVFTCATVIADLIYCGTFDTGVFTTPLSGSGIENITPNGPERNNVFAMDVTATSTWAVYGGYDINYNPYNFYGGDLTTFDLNKYTKETGWKKFDYENIFEAKNLTRVIVNPMNEGQVYVSSYHSGLLKIENDVPSILYNQDNTGTDGLEPPPSFNTIRTNGTVFDGAGNLWVTNSLVKNAIKVLRTGGQWQSYDMSPVVNSLSAAIFSRLNIDKNGTKWVGTRDSGLIGFNESYGPPRSLRDTPDTGNMPSPDVRVAVPDNRGQLWIGTRKGLRVLSSVDEFLTGNQLIAESIIIVEEDLAQELLFEQFITDIFVDGANNKWIGTGDAGVFYISPDGQKTLYHFTTDNSPLPSNSINDIDINQVTGEVFFATDRGLVSFKGISMEGQQNLDNVYVYPNPVRPEFTGSVKVSGLMDKANVKIADIEGNLVHEAIASGGTIEWDTTAFGKYRVASGVYMVFVSSDDGAETKVKKIMIVR